MSKHFEFFDDLRQTPIGQVRVVLLAQVLEILPPSWRDERVAGPEEWFVNTGRGLGLDIRFNVERAFFIVNQKLPS